MPPPAGAAAQTRTANGKKTLDHSAYGTWNRISGQLLSADGRWALYEVEADSVDAVLHVRGTNGQASHRVDRGDGGALTDDGRFAVFLIKPSKAAVKQAA